MVKKYIERKIYWRKINPFIDKDIIKVITGQRRTGKSVFLLQVIDKIKKKKPKADIIYINKELAEYDFIKNYKDLLKYIEENTSKKKKVYVFMDEIQDIESFEKALRHLKAKGRYDIYCSGSNANLISGELATYLSGRYVEIRIYSLSYSEFLEFHNLKDDDYSLLKYIKYGGLPYIKNLDLNDEVVYNYIQGVYNTILLNDIVKRYKIRNINFLKQLVNYIADNVGSLISAKRISDFLKSQRINISPNIVLDYLNYLSNAFFIFQVPRFDIRGKKIFEINEKYYFEDLGIRHSILPYTDVDMSKILENLVCLHLHIQGFNVYVGVNKYREIDFIAQKQNKTIYIQVVSRLTEENKEREFGNLLQIKDNYPKYVVSMDDKFLSGSDYRGIKHIYIRDFLKLNL